MADKLRGLGIGWCRGIAVGVFRPIDGIIGVVNEWSFAGRVSLIDGEAFGFARNCPMLSAVCPVVAVGGGRGLGPHLVEC